MGVGCRADEKLSGWRKKNAKCYLTVALALCAGRQEYGVPISRKDRPLK